MLAEMIPVILPLQMRTGSFIRLAVRQSHPLNVGRSSSSNSRSVMPHIALKSSRILMFFKLFSSLKMLIWLNLLIPVIKRKRRYCPNPLRGLKNLRSSFRSSCCKGDIEITVQKRSVVFVNQDNDRQTGLFIRTADHTLQTSSRSLFLLFRPINLFTTK